MNGLSLPPVGLMQGRFCLSSEPVAYLADSPQTALYESLLRRETVSRTLSELRRRCLVEFVTSGPLRLADVRGLAEPYAAPFAQYVEFMAAGEALFSRMA